MSFYLNRTGAAEGPFAEQQILEMIQKGEVTQANICAVGQSQWQPLVSHPAFAAAVAQRSAGAGGYGAAPPAYGAPAAAPTQPSGGYGGPPAAGAYGGPPAQGYGAPAQQATAQGYGSPAAAQGYGPPGPAAQPYGPPPGQAQAYGPAPGPGQAQAGPTAPGYGGPPPGAGYGPPAAAAYGGPPGYGAAAYPGTGLAPAPTKKGGKGLLIAGILIVVLLLAGGAVAAFFILVGGRGPEIAQALPRDTELFFEVPSVKRLALDAHGLRFVDQKIADEKKLIDDATQNVSEAFDLSKDDAQSLLFSIASMGGGARKLDKDGEGAFIVGFSGDAAVETLLKTKRFSEAGAFGDSGKKYLLAEKKVEGTPPKDPMKLMLFGMQLQSGKDVLVWFPKKKLLVGGNETFVSDVAKVLEQGAASLEKNESYEKASKDFGSDARIVSFFDPSAALASASSSSSSKDMIDGFFKNQGPITAAMRVKDAGAVLDMTARFTGNKYPKSGMAAPIKLDIVNRLPAETFAYAAFMPRGNMTGAEAEKQVLDQVGAISKEEAVHTEAQLREMERAIGVTFTKLVDSIGEQAVIAVAAPDTFTIDPARGEKQLTDLAAFVVIKLNDEAPLKTGLAKLKELEGRSIEEQATIREEGGGFVVTSKSSELPISLQAKFIDKQLVLAVGSTPLVDKGLKAITSGSGSLESNAAHKAALASLPEKTHFVMWFDAGRFGDTLQRSPLIKQQIEQSGFDINKFKLTGDDRITAALAVDVETQNDVWTFRMHSLNTFALGAAGGASALIGAANATAALNPPPTGLTGLGTTTAIDTANLGTLTPPSTATATATEALVPTTPPTPASFKVGDKVDVEWRGKFYTSTILAVLPGDKFKIHYDGWASSWDEVVPIKRMKAK
ncbi:MAG TPA: hypothetical protein VGP93_04330 [Polyangiaceae bacterium]|nr:hypothetical protein [Polyangiaceae bacterium]